MSAKNIARKLRKYARKLEKDDITKEEADEIYRLIHGPFSKKYFKDADFVQAVIEWYGQVEKKLPERETTLQPFRLNFTTNICQK